MTRAQFSHTHRSFRQRRPPLHLLAGWYMYSPSTAMKTDAFSEGYFSLLLPRGRFECRVILVVMRKTVGDHRRWRAGVCSNGVSRRHRPLGALRGCHEFAGPASGAERDRRGRRERCRPRDRPKAAVSGDLVGLWSARAYNRWKD